MKRRHLAFALICPTLATWALCASPTSLRAEDPTEKQIAELVGEWEITYSNDAVRVYTIDKQGNVSFDSDKLKGRITRKAEALLLAFDGDSKLERLTMGVDGRLFVEHFMARGDLLGKRPAAIGIGIRQK